MEFKEKQAIYLQIADYVCNQILAGRWTAGEKILSIRELAVRLEVNPNTVMRTYEYLQNAGIITNKRGIGFFAAENAPQIIKQMRRKQFFATELPDFFKEIDILGIDFEEIIKHYQNLTKK